MDLRKLKQNRKKELNARTMIIFAQPKIGKTVALLGLEKVYPDDVLLVDFEKGAGYYDGNIAECNTKEEFLDLIKNLKAQENNFKIIILDTLTSLFDNIINELCVDDFNKNPPEGQAPLPKGSDITSLAYGAGYKRQSDMMIKIQKTFLGLCDNLILVGHTADRKIEAGGGAERTIKDLSLPGKSKSILAVKADAVGLMYRKENENDTLQNVNVLSFITSNNDSVTGTRVNHLDGKTFDISEKLEDGTIVTHWDKIYK